MNKSNDINTLYSCEGHNLGDDAYIYFNVSDDGWNIFWQKVMPELSSRFIYDHPEIPNALYQLTWLVNRTEGGISIHSELNNFTIKETGRVLTTWEQKKKLFWDILIDTFLKNFK